MSQYVHLLKLNKNLNVKIEKGIFYIKNPIHGKINLLFILNWFNVFGMNF